MLFCLFCAFCSALEKLELSGGDQKPLPNISLKDRASLPEFNAGCNVGALAAPITFFHCKSIRMGNGFIIIGALVSSEWLLGSIYKKPAKPEVIRRNCLIQQDDKEEEAQKNEKVKKCFNRLFQIQTNLGLAAGQIYEDAYVVRLVLGSAI